MSQSVEDDGLVTVRFILDGGEFIEDSECECDYITKPDSEWFKTP
jgi:hypothetical protein